MNTGIQDAHNLVNKMAPIWKANEGSGNIDSNLYEHLKQCYHSERHSIGLTNLNIAMKYYNTSLNIAKILGSI